MNEYLKKFTFFTDEEIEEVLKLGYFKTYKKNDFFLKEGEICTDIAFIHSGIFRSYYYSQDDKDMTYCLSFPDTFFSAYSSFISQQKSLITIQALTDAEVFVLPKSEIDRLVNTKMNWLRFFKLITEQYYMLLENRVFALQTEKAETRYLKLLNERPNYIEKIPLQYLASYLGITQRHLSRLRATISF